MGLETKDKGFVGGALSLDERDFTKRRVHVADGMRWRSVFM